MKKGYKMTEEHRLAIKAGVARAKAVKVQSNGEPHESTDMTINSRGYVFTLARAREVYEDLREIFGHE